MAYRYMSAKDVNEAIIYSCVSEWEYYSEGRFTTNGPWYGFKVKAIFVGEDDKVYDCSFTVVSGVNLINYVVNGQALSEEVDVVTTELGEIAYDFFSERIKEIEA